MLRLNIELHGTPEEPWCDWEYFTATANAGGGGSMSLEQAFEEILQNLADDGDL